LPPVSVLLRRTTCGAPCHSQGAWHLPEAVSSEGLDAKSYPKSRLPYVSDQRGAAGPGFSLTTSQQRELADFFLDQARHIAEMNCLRLAFLKLDGKRIAFEYGWQAGRHLLQAKVGYDAS